MEKQNEDKKFSLGGVVQKSKEYAETRLKLLQLMATERASKLIASLMLDGMKLVLSLFVLFFLSLALGFYFSELLDSNALGFLATGGVFILLILLILLLEKRLKSVFINLSIRRFFDQSDEEDGEENEEAKEDLEDGK